MLRLLQVLDLCKLRIEAWFIGCPVPFVLVLGVKRPREANKAPIAHRSRGMQRSDRPQGATNVSSDHKWCIERVRLRFSLCSGLFRNAPDSCLKRVAFNDKLCRLALEAARRSSNIYKGMLSQYHALYRRKCQNVRFVAGSFE